MNSKMEELIKNLGYTDKKGLFHLADADKWINQFPYRIGRVLKDVIRPYAFFSPFHGSTATNPEHPVPLNNPMILFFDNPAPELEEDIHRWVFSFSQAPVIFISRDDKLDIFHGFRLDEGSQTRLEKIDAKEEDFEFLNLITGKTWEKFHKKYFDNAPRVDKYLLKNITDARRILMAEDTGGLPPRTANRLIGRLLFVRYLIDRNVAFEDERYIKGKSKTDRRKSLEVLLQNKEATYQFFKSLTDSFNGDLFPLREKGENNDLCYDEKTTVEQRHLDVMYDLFACSDFFVGTSSYEGYAVQRSLFNYYDFEVIPVELISSIYENFLAESDSRALVKKALKDFPSKQKELQAHYTPPFLVDYILSETVTPHLDKQTEASCKVLDPACGSGIFLVETLRKLIEKEKNSKPSPITDERLWELVEENIFGIDIDDDAIEIAIFSLYITLLDYKSPKEIISFRFRKLRGTNLFGGKDADFFNEEHHFNTIFKEKHHLDFVIGNPPWGAVKNCRNNEYLLEKIPFKKKPSGEQEISQAFMIRAGDLASPFKKTRCALIVTGKNLYNVKAKEWRGYFLDHFRISKVLELSAINNKNSGGPHIFEKAKLPSAIIFFTPNRDGENPGNSLVTHITARPNIYFNCFQTILIERNDLKKILQKHFMESRGGHDWLWSIILHGNLLDFTFIKKIKEIKNPMPIAGVKEKFQLSHSGGFKGKDQGVEPANRKCTREILEFGYLEIKKKGESDLQPFIASPSATFGQKLDRLVREGIIEQDKRVPQLPDIHYFKGKRLLLKNGLNPDDFHASAAVCDEDAVFSDSICAVKPKKGVPLTPEIDEYFHCCAAIFNSDLFSYYIFHTGTSAGAYRIRANQNEFFNFPLLHDREISALAQKIRRHYQTLRKESNPKKREKAEGQIKKLRIELEQLILEKYDTDDEDKALIDYTLNVAIPVFKRRERRKGQPAGIYKTLSLKKAADRAYLRQYAEVFVEHFGKRFFSDEKYFSVAIYVSPSFIGCNFKISRRDEVTERITFHGDGKKENIEALEKIGQLGFQKLSESLYISRDVRGFQKKSFYVIKPNQWKLWHKAVAYGDLSEFIYSLVKAEIEKRSA